ncbi:MAG: hypothetical protein AAGC55_09530 [Myxococcota bacterium]
MGKGTKRTFTQQETALILDRAAKLHDTTALVSESSEYDLDELKSIAAEAGISSEAIEAAVRTLGPAGESSGALVPAAASSRRVSASPSSGTSSHIDLSAVCAGQLPQDERGELIALIRRVAEDRGQTELTASTVEWQRRGLLGRERVTVTSRKGRTKIEVSGRYRRGSVLAHLTGGAAGAFATMATLGALGILDGLGPGSLLFLAGGAVAGSRWLWRRMWRGRRRQLDRLLAEVSEFAEDNRLPGNSSELPALPAADSDELRALPTALDRADESEDDDIVAADTALPAPSHSG